MRSQLFVSILLVSGFAVGQVDFATQTPNQRFSSKMAIVNQYLATIPATGTVDDKINQLDISGVREQMTDLQNLIRIYTETKAGKALEPFYTESKKLEDLISHVRDEKYFLQSATDETRPKYQALLDKEVADYTQFLQNSSLFKTGDESFEARLMKVVNGIIWPAPEKDRNNVLQVLAHRLEKIQAKAYDLSLVELGIHEFKRDVRRFSYLRRGYPGLVNDDSMICPLTADPQNPPGAIKNEGYTCSISMCLTQKLDSATYSLDSIKMEGLAYEMRGEKVPAEIISQAQAIHDDIKSSKVLVFLSQQLKSCVHSASQDSKKDSP
jgi:hypothetical protein